MRALLGLYDPADTTDWGPIRAAQMNAGSQLALFMLAANVVGAALIVLNFAALVPLWKLASWWALVAAVGVAVAFRRLAARHRTERTATRGDVRDTVLDGLSLGAVWSIAPLLFGAYANPEAATGLWIVLSILMVASSFAMAALPLATRFQNTAAQRWRGRRRCATNQRSRASLPPDRGTRSGSSSRAPLNSMRPGTRSSPGSLRRSSMVEKEFSTLCSPKPRNPPRRT